MGNLHFEPLHIQHCSSFLLLLSSTPAFVLQDTEHSLVFFNKRLVYGVFFHSILTLFVGGLNVVVIVSFTSL